MDDLYDSIKNLNLRLLVWIVLIGLFLPLVSNGQGCPQFEIKKIVDTSRGQQNGAIEITIKSTKTYSVENFDIRQKEHKVTGALGYDVDMRVSRNSLKVKGLKKSDEMYLKEYVILFSDRSCDDGNLIEAGTFKIK